MTPCLWVAGLISGTRHKLQFEEWDFNPMAMGCNVWGDGLGGLWELIGQEFLKNHPFLALGFYLIAYGGWGRCCPPPANSELLL